MSDTRQTDLTLGFSPTELQHLEQVRVQQGLDSLQQTAEWLAKTAVRKAARRTTGRGRALYPVEGNP
jgi:hypothetical protein